MLAIFPLGIFISLTLNTCLYVIHFYEISGINSLGLVPIMQRAVMLANKRTTIRFQELNQKKYRTPLIVTLSKKQGWRGPRLYLYFVY
jgi:hypothetical protein